MTSFLATSVLVWTIYIIMPTTSVSTTVTPQADTSTVTSQTDTPGTNPHPPGAQQPTERQLQLAFLLQNLMKVNSALENQLQGLIELLKTNLSATAVASNPMMQLAMNALVNWLATPPSSGSTANATNMVATGSGSSNTQDGGNIMASLIGNPLFQDTLKILLRQITQGLVQAQRNNLTIGIDLSSLMALVNPLVVVQQLLGSRSARMVIANEPQGLISDACYNDVMDTFDSFVALKKWAIDMFDAAGKPNPGIQRGSFYFVGSYDQCYLIEPALSAGDVIGNVTVTSSRQFGTKFCRADISIPQSLIDALNVDTRGIRLKLTWGLCVPNSCHSSDMEGLFKLAPVNRLPLPVEKVYCYDDLDISEDKTAIAAICVLSVFAFLVVVGTVYDVIRSQGMSSGSCGKTPEGPQSAHAPEPVLEKYTEIVTISGDNGEIPSGYMPHRETYLSPSLNTNGDVTAESPSQNYKQPNGGMTATRDSRRQREPFIGRIVKCFSLYTNVPKILHAKAGRDAVTCVHGIRFLSLTWVVLGHTYNYGIISQDDTFTADNLLDFVPVMQRFTYQAVIAGGFAVDTFYVLSAFLLTWLQLKETKKKRKKCSLEDCIMYYFHRFWRLTPLYMIVLLCFAGLYRYIGSGPFWPETIWGAEHCKTNWWTNLLYVNNLVQVKAQCMGWSWYLATDMQFYVISPIFLVLMYKCANIGAMATGVLLATGISIAFWREHEISGSFFTMKSDGGKYWENVYTVPWCRVGCWAVGMLLGLIIYKRGQKPIRNKLLVVVGWLLATAAALSIVYSPYSENKDGGEPWTNVQRAFYEGFGRPAWGLCVAWVIFACHTGCGGLINSILSWNGFIPLSRLTYAAYLVHPICMMIYVFSRRTLLHVNDYNVIYLYLGHFCITYMVSFVASLMFEAPAMGLEKVLFRRERRT